jgi:hypothetical protein
LTLRTTSLSSIAKSVEFDPAGTPNVNFTTFEARQIIENNPELLVESKLLVESMNEVYRDPREYERDEYKDLDDLIRMCGIKHADGESFWPLHQLEKIMTAERISDELLPILSEEDATSVAKDIQARFLKVFAILVIIRKSECIGDFMNENVADTDLPLRNDQTHQSHLLFSDGSVVQGTRDWHAESRESFLAKQHRMNPIILDMDRKDGKYSVRHIDLHPKAVLPITRRTSLNLRGGYSTFSSVDIDPHCHKFKDGVLGKVSKASPTKRHKLTQKTKIKTEDTFMLKQLTSSDQKAFEAEVEALKRATTFRHDHLITLLVTWNLAGRNELLFPMAQLNLEEYWLHNAQPDLSLRRLKWISRQIEGLAGALSCMHNPPQEDIDPSQNKFGRHGDIKPENILWFEALDDEDGILVLADMGLTKFNSYASRSVTINASGERKIVVQDPRYTPPEFSVKNATLSRDCDMWSFGCVLLEMVCHALEGADSRRAMLQSLETEDLNGVNMYTYYQLDKKQDGRLFMLVNEKVTEVSHAPNLCKARSTNSRSETRCAACFAKVHAVLPRATFFDRRRTARREV